jgi:hypothetical protein
VAFTIYGRRHHESIVRLYLDGSLQQETLEIVGVRSSEAPVRLGRRDPEGAAFRGTLSGPEFHSSFFSQLELQALASD